MIHTNRFTKIGFLLIAVLLCFAPPSTAQRQPMVASKQTSNKHCFPIEVPRTSPKDLILTDTAAHFTLRYDSTRLLAVFVAYKLTRQDTEGATPRKNSFHVDDRLRARGLPYATGADYKNSGYDRGHLLPSADRKQSPDANHATFSLANCAPQTPALNRGAWRLLEEALRKEALVADTLYIVTGPATFSSQSKVGRMALPSSFFKAVVTLRSGKYSGRAYLMPNDIDPKSAFNTYRVSIDSVERITGLDLFFRLPDTIENRIEAM